MSLLWSSPFFWVFAIKVPPLAGLSLGSRKLMLNSLPRCLLQHFIPFALIFEHGLSQETNGWHSVAEQLIVEFLQ